MNNRYILISGIILGLFAVVGTGIVGITHSVTKETIQANEELALQRQLNQILPEDQYDNKLVNSTLTLQADNRLGQSEASIVYIAKQQDSISAMIFNVIAPKGYSGEIKMLVGVNMDASLAGVRIVSHKETPGLGDAIETSRSNWVLNFNGKSLQQPQERNWKVRRDGGDFDQFTGATITPRAVVQAVHLCLVYFDRHKLELIEQYQQSLKTPVTKTPAKKPVATKPLMTKPMTTKQIKNT